MNPDPELQKILGDLNERVGKLEKHNPYHQHTGLDSPQIDASNLIGGAGYNSRARAYLSGDQAITTGGVRQITFDAESFDTENAFDSSTNHRYTAKHKGYYLVHTELKLTAGALNDQFTVYIYKNGSSVAQSFEAGASATTNHGMRLTDLVQLNPSDYVDIRVDTTGGNWTIKSGAIDSFMFVHRLS